jgi:N4-gp56 family major capsid protein
MAQTIPNTGPYNVDQRKYGQDGTDSSIGNQIRTDYYKKRALIEVVKESVFSPLADATAMPKHYGKTIKQYHYLPLLDDRNINDQGIDASGAVVNQGVTISIAWGGTKRANAYTGAAAGTGATGPHNVLDVHAHTAKGEGANAAAALADAKAKAVEILEGLGFTGADYDALKTAATSGGFKVYESDAYPVSGNLYGSSKDVGTIAAKLPVLSEHGGRVNRVGFKRIEIEGSIEKFGFFDEYTADSLQFDTDEELEMHINREMLRGANEITEDMIQMDLLNGAGVVMYAGTAISDDELSAEDSATSTVTYMDFIKLGIELQNNRTPRQTKIISGSRMVDTKVIDGGYIMFVGAELIPQLKRLEDFQNEKAFIEAKHYASAGNLMKGEIGSIDQFRIVVAQEMQHWAGAGAAVGTNPGYRSTDVGGTEYYDVFPMLVVGSGSFTTIGFQTDGNGVKFKIQHRKPGVVDKNDPYGESGFMSIKWYYGSMILRPERLAVLKTVAEW